jgi:sec-independent protein translocase protein TatB
MFNVGSGEFLVIFLLALIVLGPDKLPETARKVGKVIGDLRQMSSGFQAEMREAMDVDSIKQALNPTTALNQPAQYREDPPSTAVPASSDPNDPAPIPDIEPRPTPEPTEIRAAAPGAPGMSEASEQTSASAPIDIHAADLPPAKGQQGAA